MPSIDRRHFVLGSGAAVLGGLTQPLDRLALHVGGKEELRVGLIGCGGRGSGAVINALNADPAARLVAMCDVFPDRLDASLGRLQKSQHAKRIQVDEEHRFTGFDGYKHLIDAVDVVLLAATPHFRPRHLAAAVRAGKHVFCEKPVAVDVPGVRSVMETSALAAKNGTSLVSGLCYRYDTPKREVMKRIHDGAVGRIVALQCTYNTGGLWHRGSKPEWSDMEYQIRNWLYFTWLSGDHIAEQSIHSLDKILWAMQDEPPVKVTASGGRINRIEPKYGNVFDHFNTVFEWKDGVKLFHSCRQWAGADSDVSDYVFGTDGVAAIQRHSIKGANAWRWRGRSPSMYDNEHVALFRSIRENKPINNGDYMCKATLMAIMGRMSAYTGKTITWDELMKSKLDLTPERYEFGPHPVAPVARPGKTPFV